jgi:hypothetical protein
MRIGFTGTSEGLTLEQESAVDARLWLFRESDKAKEFHHGLCIGADKQAHNIAFEMDYNIIGHPPSNTYKMASIPKEQFTEIRQPKDFMARNLDIVLETDVLLVCPKEFTEQLRSGTWATYRRAKWNKKSRIIIFPDGTTRREE